MEECWKTNPKERISLVKLNKEPKGIQAHLFGRAEAEVKPELKPTPRDVPGYFDPIGSENPLSSTD
jgi:hypothetical protein